VSGLRCSPPHPVADKGIERFAESGENGLKLFSASSFRCAVLKVIAAMAASLRI